MAKEGGGDATNIVKVESSRILQEHPLNYFELKSFLYGHQGASIAFDGLENL